MSLFPYTAAGAYALSGAGGYLRANTVGTYYVAADGMVTQATTGY